MKCPKCGAKLYYERIVDYSTFTSWDKWECSNCEWKQETHYRETLKRFNKARQMIKAPLIKTEIELENFFRLHIKNIPRTLT